tara:strand:- start:1421 stop:3709 length:2289 start_codon:yes stop_codon:yes gene_type:complete
MTNSQINSGSRSTLAKLLAKEDISVRHSAVVKTAHFELKSRVLMLPIWDGISPELYDMLVIHEVGHALETPMDAWIEAIDRISAKYCKNSLGRGNVKDFLNVVEDPRIDKLQMRRYPGSKRDYAFGYQELHERDFFGLAKIKAKHGKSINDLTFIDRANIYWKGGKKLNIRFSKEEMAFIDRIGLTETFDDVELLAEEIYVWSQKQTKKKKKEPKSKVEQAIEDLMEDLDAVEPLIPSEVPPMEDAESEPEDETEGDVPDEDEDEDEPDGDAPDEDEDEDEDEEDNAFRPSSPTSDIDSEEFEEDEDEAEDEEDEDEEPESLTSQAAEENAGSLVKTGVRDYAYAQTPTMNLGSIIDDYKKVLVEQDIHYQNMVAGTVDSYSSKNYWIDFLKRADDELIKFRMAENPTISYMVKEFELRKSAAVYSRSAQSKTGVLDTNKLHSYRYNDDVFKKLTVIPEGKNHGFVMFLDWSGSMHGNLQDTVRQLLSLVWFCKRVAIPFEVFTFRDARSGKKEDQFSTNHGDIVPQVFTLRNIFSSRMNQKDFNTAVRNMWLQSYRQFPCDPLGFTPLYQTMMVSSKIVNDFRKRNGVEVVNTIFLTDGDGDGLGRPVGDTSFGGYGTNKECLITDSVTKKVYRVNGMGGKDVQKTFLQMLKDQTGSNIMGFYLTNSVYRNLPWKYKDNDKRTEEMKSYRDCGFFAAKDVGYDEFYVINPKTLSGKKNESMKVNPDLDKKKAQKEFMRSLTQKNNNRILLKAFMAKVCQAA